MEVSEHYQDILAQCDSYHTLHWNGLNTVFVIAKLRTLLKKINPITIQCWMYHANVLSSLSLLGKRNKPKVFWGIHHSLASIKEESISVKISLLLSKYLASKPTGIIYCAKSSLLQHEQFGFKNDNTYVIANGVFLSDFCLNSELHEPCVVGFAGRYHIAKGYPYLFATIAELKKYPIIFKIAGNDANLKNKEIEDYFNKYKLDRSKVILLDQVSNMPDFYRSIDVFLMTSITEGFPNVLVEAMASGVPCITTDVGDARYIVNDDDYVVPSRDILSLKMAILQYFHLDQIKKKELKQTVQNRVIENFSMEHISRKYISTWLQNE